MNRLGVQDTLPYLLVGLCVWVAVFESGVHATIAGVALGLMTPVNPYYSRGKFLPVISDLMDRFRRAGDEGNAEAAEQLLGQMEDVVEGSEAPVDRLERTLHPFTSFVVVPLFALANAGVPLHGDIISDSLHSSVTLGIIIGLLVGKPIGILLASWLAVRAGIARLPDSVTWPQMLGVSVLAGVGFTVALFINELAFSSQELVDQGKIGILAASVAAGALGLATLLAVSGRPGPQPGTRPQ
jgi:NhaA family Na+:H+ antiporter